MDILKHAHSGLRWVVLVLLLAAIVNAFSKWRGRKPFTEGDRKLGLFTFISTHIQLLVGLVLYFMSPNVVFAASSMKEPQLRFFLVEHIALMVLAIAVISIGYSRAKRALEDSQKFRTTFLFFLIGLILILIAIPWPPKYGAGWF